MIGRSSGRCGNSDDAEEIAALLSLKLVMKMIGITTLFSVDVDVEVHQDIFGIKGTHAEENGEGSTLDDDGDDDEAGCDVEI